jgi:hypothetical protein
VEHYGGQQGRCDLLITPHYDTGMYNQPGQTQWIFPNLDVRAPEGGFPGFKKMPPQKIEIPKNLGMAHGILRTKPNSQLQVFVEGAQALATVYHYQNPNLQETLVLSPIPSAISFRKSGAFNLNQLPAGEYKLYIKPQTNHISATEGNELAKKSALEPIKTFTVTAGQNVDLGVIEFDMDIEKTGKPNNEIDIQELLRNYGWDNYGEDADQGDLLRQ